MREQEMRQRIERFLQTRLRSMVLPATLGLGLAVGACNSGGLVAGDGGGDGGDHGKDDVGNQSATEDSATVSTKYMAQIPDARDTGMVLRYMAQMPTDAAPDSDRMVALYMAQLPLPRS